MNHSSGKDSIYCFYFFNPQGRLLYIKVVFFIIIILFYFFNRCLSTWKPCTVSAACGNQQGSGDEQVCVSGAQHCSALGLVPSGREVRDVDTSQGFALA